MHDMDDEDELVPIEGGVERLDELVLVDFGTVAGLVLRRYRPRRTAVVQMRLVCGAGSGVFPKGGVTAAGELVGTGTCRACAKTRPATPTSTAAPDIYDTPTDRAPS